MVAFFVEKRGSLVDCRLAHGTGTNALGANLHPLHFAGLQLSADRLKIGHEAPLGLVVGMADIVADLRALPANIANF
jgi:hypothetical protein